MITRRRKGRRNKF